MIAFAAVGLVTYAQSSNNDNSTVSNSTIEGNCTTTTTPITTPDNSTCIPDDNTSVANVTDNNTGSGSNSTVSSSDVNNTTSETPVVVNNLPASTSYGLNITKIVPYGGSEKESVTIQNNWDIPVQLQGYVIHEGICGNELTIDQNITVQPGDSVTLYTKDLEFPRQQMFHWHDSGYLYYKSNEYKF